MNRRGRERERRPGVISGRKKQSNRENQNDDDVREEGEQIQEDR